MERAEEKRLLEQVQRGDANAFAQLYRAHVQIVYRYIQFRVNDAPLAEDMTGDVFVRALKDIQHYEDRGKPFVAWLYSIAHARVIDHYRRVGRRPMESDIEETVVPVENNLDQGMLRAQAAAELRRAIAALTDDQQQVVILRFVEGYRIEQVAKLMNKNANAIKALQHRALRSLAGKLERSGFDVESILAGLS